MKRNVFAVFASIALAGTLVAAQNYPQPQPQQPQPAAQPAPQAPAASQAPDKAPDATLTGCLVQGSGPTVFLLENARMATDDRTAKGKSFVVDATGTVLDLKAQLNHEVRIVGMAEAKMAPTPAAGQKVSEKDLPKLSAKSIAKIADTCPAATPAASPAG